MKLTDELKNKITTAETLEEKISIITESGIKLTDEELEEIAGGVYPPIPPQEFTCSRCGKKLIGMLSAMSHMKNVHGIS